MRSLAIGAPFAHLLGYLQKGKAGKKFKFDIRPDTTVYLCPKKDRVTVVYALKFFDKVDTAIARIFLQVLYAVLHMYMYKMPRIASTYITHHTYTCNVTYIYLLRAWKTLTFIHCDCVCVCVSSVVLLREQRAIWIFWMVQSFVETKRTVQNAPPVALSKDPPREVKVFGNAVEPSDDLGYISFSMCLWVYVWLFGVYVCVGFFILYLSFIYFYFWFKSDDLSSPLLTCALFVLWSVCLNVVFDLMCWCVCVYVFCSQPFCLDMLLATKRAV